MKKVAQLIMLIAATQSFCNYQKDKEIKLIQCDTVFYGNGHYDIICPKE